MTTTNTTSLYPRTLYLWTQADDRKLLKGINEGDNLIVLAESLEREHVTVVRRLDELGLFHFDSGSEEWVEIMSLAVGGAALNAAIAWCNGAEDRLPYGEIEQMLMADFRREFELARSLGLEVCTVDAIGDLTWLLQQPESVQMGYGKAVEAVLGRFDIPTPATLKAQVLGVTAAAAPWPLTFTGGTTKTRRARSRRSSTKRSGYRRRRTIGASRSGVRTRARRSTAA